MGALAGGGALVRSVDADRTPPVVVGGGAGAFLHAFVRFRVSMNDVRFLQHLRLGLAAGLLAGALVGLGEAFSILARTGGSRFGVLSYACMLYGALGMAGGGCAAVAASLVLRRAASSWVFSFVAVFAPLGTVITLFLLRRGFFREQMPPVSVILGVLVGFGVFGLLCWFLLRPLLEKSALRDCSPPLGVLPPSASCSSSPVWLPWSRRVRVMGRRPSPRGTPGRIWSRRGPSS